MITIDEVTPSPWERHEWSGNLVALDGCSNQDFTKEDVAEVIAFGTSGDRWDGETVCIIKLRDGRFAGWEAEYGPTGDGFCHDAYGGNSDIMFARDEALIRLHLSERAKELLGVPW